MAYADVSAAFAAGQIGVEQVEELLVEVYAGDQDSIDARRSRLIRDGQIVKFQLVALNREATLAAERETPPPPRFDPDPTPEEFLKDVPEPDDDDSGFRSVVPEILRRVSVLDAVRRWGKSQAVIKEGNRIEGIHVRCPFSGHEDYRPSAWVNTNKGTWNCGKCELGGDSIDFYAARRYGLESPAFHKTDSFLQVVDEIARELGIEEPTTKAPIIDLSDESDEPDEPGEPKPEPEPDPAPTPAPASVPEPVPPSSEADEPHTITTAETTAGIDLDYDDQESSAEAPRFEWTDLHLPSSSFLAQWMMSAQEELPWIPSEYFLMLGFQAIGLAMGHEMTSVTYGIPLSGSILLAIVGSSGRGKSLAAGRLRDLLMTVDGPAFHHRTGKGVKLVPSAGSPEALTVSIKTEIEDPNDPLLLVEAPTTAWMFEDELASFMSRASRKGGGHIKQRVMALHDFVKKRPEPEVVADDFSLSGGRRTLSDSFFSALFLTQTDAMRTLIAGEDLVSGFFSRIVPVVGASRRKRSAMQPAFDPNPSYYEAYAKLWSACRGARSQLPFATATLQMLDAHKFFDDADVLSEAASIYSRLRVTTLRIALMLAVNAQDTSVRPDHLQSSIDMVSSYVIPCYQYFITAAKASDVTDLRSQILDWVKEEYARTNVWPARQVLSKTRFFRDARGDTGQAALEGLFYDRLLVSIKLTLKLNGQSDILIIPDGAWSGYAACNGRVMKKEEVYAHA